jgi:hypothetical protein
LKLRLGLKKFKGTGVTHVEEREETRILVDGCPKPPEPEKKEVKEEEKKEEKKEETEKPKEEVKEVVEEKAKLVRNSEWNYDEHGADWPAGYPDCGLPQQSPINLIDPVTEFGKAYEIHPSEDDATKSNYKDLEETNVYFDPLRYTIGIVMQAKKEEEVKTE